METETTQSDSARRRRRKRAAVLGAVLAAGVGAAVMSTATGALASERHFIKVSTHGAPTWSASGDLYAADGTRVYHWHEHHVGGNYALWRWTWNGDKGWVNASVSSSIGGVPSGTSISKKPLDRDYCFLVDALGGVSYSGDSKTGNCTAA